jgi:hypothetical protein
LFGFVIVGGIGAGICGSLRGIRVGGGVIVGGIGAGIGNWIRIAIFGVGNFGRGISWLRPSTFTSTRDRSRSITTILIFF